MTGLLSCIATAHAWWSCENQPGLSKFARGALAHASASLGVDFDKFDPDEPVNAEGSQAVRSNLEAMTTSFGPGWTTRHLLDRFVLGSRQLPMVGSPGQIADMLMHWVEDADVDGFNLSRTVIPECLESFIDLVVPELQDRGVFKTAYAPGTYRNKLFGAGDRLPDTHPAARERWS